MKNMQTLLGNDFFNSQAWDKEAACYDAMNSMEGQGTEKELDLISLANSDTVLDIGCGPGRMTIPIAKRVKTVIAIDSSPAMVEICRRNIEKAGVNNADCLKLDWESEDDYKRLPMVDVIIQARWSGGASPLKKYLDICRKCVVFIEWEKNPPRIARNMIFNGCYSKEAINQYPELQPFNPSAYTDFNFTKKEKAERDIALRNELKCAGITMNSTVIGNCETPTGVRNLESK